MTDKVIKNWRQKLSNMKKEDYIVLLLLGVLLLIVSLPTDRGEEEKKNAAEQESVSGREEGTGEVIPGNTGEGMEGQRSGDPEEDMETAAVEAGNFGDGKSYDIDVYVDNLEKRVEEMLSGMEGAGKVKVMITVSDMGTEILEKDKEITTSDLEETDSAGGSRKSQENGQREEVIYIRDADGNEKPYVVCRKLPEVTGVVVMAEGAGNTKVKENIIGAVGVLFNLNEHRIKVIRMKS